MYSRLVSLKPPFPAFVRGVRIARVMTMSSAFLDWLAQEVSYEQPVLAEQPGQ
jgi:hypothetical protein